MKLHATTLRSRGLLVKSILMMAVLIFGLIFSPQLVKPAAADQYDDLIRALQQDMDRFQAEANRLNGEAVTLQTALAQLTNEKAALQAQIDINQKEYERLSEQIVQTEKKIKDSQDGLGTIIADMYIDDSISPIEMLASSQNIGDYLDKQAYRSAIRDQLTSTIKIIKQLKQELDAKKVEVAKVLQEQTSARDTLQAKETAQARLLAQTQNSEANYQTLIGSRAQQIAQARATQAALNSRGTSTGGYKLFSSGLLAQYITDTRFGMWNNSNCPMVFTYMSSEGSDGNGGDSRGYGCRQCASYVAWKINQVKGYWPSWGNAANFGSHGTASVPRADTIAVLYDGGPGHVAWVETNPYISTSGPLAGKEVIVVSQYNFNYGQGYGMYSMMELSVNFFDTYRAL